MMSTKKRSVKAAGAGALCALALVLHGDAQAADSLVPLEWNVGPMTGGAYLESFDGGLPAWAAAGFNAVTNVFPSMEASSLPGRSNAWFGANVKVLQLETEGEVVTNTLSHPPDTPVSFAAVPVYVDMRVRFDAVTDAPDSELLNNAKLALFVSADRRLVAVHAGGVSTNAAELDTNKWHQVTIKLYGGNAFDVLLNDDKDAPVFTGLTVKNAGDANTLSSANFYGTGYVDELYVSRGDPAYLVTGPTEPIPALPGPGSNPPTDEEQTRINAWLAGNAGINSDTQLNMTQDQLSRSYLLGELNGDESTATAVQSYTFGISKIDLVSPTEVRVTARLTVDEQPKNGLINGKIQLAGKVDIGDDWTTLPGAVTPAFADFTGGEATYTFALPAGGYKFFKPLIVP
jgi:hypothetical protein